jgi:hypothetical protein
MEGSLARLRQLGSRSGRIVWAWLGPLALGGYALTQFARALPGVNGDLVWALILAVGVIPVLVLRRRLSPTELMALEVLAAALLADYLTSRSGGQRDLHLYLNAGAHFISHAPVYTTTAIHTFPPPPNGAERLPFLYAPPTLPFFGLLSMFPRGPIELLWAAGSAAAVVASLRAFGLGWRWALLALLWPPIEQGLYVGNLAMPALLLLGVATRLGGVLVLGPLIKPQNGILALWLIRRRAWRSLAAGTGALALIALATLPLTGLGAWRDWLSGLWAYQESQHYIAGLYGEGLGRYLPLWAFLAIAACTLVAALRARDREGLARLGLASVTASPSLHSHGFILAVPAFLRLRAEWLWLVLGLTCIGLWPGPQLALGIGVASWFVKGLARRGGDLAAEGGGRPSLHPLGSASEPWPAQDR